MSMEIALSGVKAINAELETISNNIANAGTYGFKSSRTNFASMYADTSPMGVEASSRTQSIGIGGGTLNTGRGMDVAIKGKGFFAVKEPSGQTLFTRVGIFQADREGYVTDSFGRRLQGYGVVPGTDVMGPMGDIQVSKEQLPAVASSRLDYVANLSGDWTTPTVVPFDPAEPLSYNGSNVSVVYDSLGSQHTLTQYFVRSGPNEVTVHYGFDGAPMAAGTETVLQFGTDGRLTLPAGPVAKALPLPATVDPITLNVNYTGTTQYAGQTTTTVNDADGNSSGAFLSVSIDEDGAVLAQYSNGERQRIGTVALANFPNEDALANVSDTSWTITNASGEPLYDAPGVGQAGSLVAGALEQSNVEMTSELVSLMTSQRNYQANTKVFQTQNQIMQSLMQAI
ncbi:MULTISPECIES: flagellar hook protein FlgE [Hydrogenophaga]|uniref:Flagellar hook protein FlgE n=1 Tax=Hydrogenophaga intermedia TaxID=65786 RepID=A0A1L1PJQ7_HYDIT|nr:MULTISPECIES: flagellar hook-basal body complex protein [Hydrogenophaga]AOS80699.1 flagellar biosynthesis protein FlgE [Hydrogenophaga sp. PBC]TMU78323.1 flagellar hook-basal body complex protein [Hydrogenophaga intermedia]CDN87177.1 Flagellar hook protein FlgE [Hydrogenophaga intermedia]